MKEKVNQHQNNKITVIFPAGIRSVLAAETIAIAATKIPKPSIHLVSSAKRTIKGLAPNITAALKSKTVKDMIAVLIQEYP